MTTTMAGSEPAVAIVGAGRHSTAHVHPNVARAGARLVGVCDLVEERARANASRFGANAHTDWERMLDAEDPDGVIVCIGPESHADLAPAIMERGYDVYTEKPPAPDAASALAVARTAETTGRLCMTGFKKRYARAYEATREWIDDRPEPLTSLSVDYAAASYDDAGAFLLDFCIHAIDLVGYLGGPVASVRATAREAPAAYAVTLAFESGAVGTMTLTDGRSFSVPTETVELTLDGGTFATVENSSRWRRVEDGEPAGWHEPPTFVSGGEGDAGTGHVRELEAFVGALSGDDGGEGESERPRSHVVESYRSMVRYEAIAEAARTGDSVAVDPAL